MPELWKMYILLIVAYLQLRMSNAEGNGNSLVSCAACQAVQVQNFACDVNCEVVKGNKDNSLDVSDLLEEMMQKINQLNESLSQEKQRFTKLADENSEIRSVNAGLLQKVNQLNETLTLEQQTIDKLKESRCAFAARGLEEDPGINVDSAIVVFPNVSLNTCNGYDVTTGTFIANKAGTYMFSTHALAIENYGYFRIKKNDDVICDTWVDEDYGDVTSCTTVTHLDLGDKVKVTGDNADPAKIYGDRNGFSGILIYPD